MEQKIKISYYKSSFDTKGVDLDITEFLRGIRDGRWQDAVLPVMAEKDKKKRDELKKKCPAVTVSGSFAKRKDSELRAHSGFITIDIDNAENVESIKKVLSSDSYVYACFKSVSGNGLCIMFRIDGSRHADAFDGLSKYLYEKYQLISDPSCRNLSRLRYVCYDPYIHINEDANVFKKYPPKQKAYKVNSVVFVKSDFDALVTEMYNRNVNICEDYHQWIATCYAIISEYGDTEQGRSYFHTLSSMSSKYNYDDSEKQYIACVNTLSEVKKQATISSIYHHAKVSGIDAYSQKTKEVIRAASSQHKNGVSREDIAKSLKKHNDISEDYSSPIIDQVIEKGIEHKSENIIDDIIYFLQPFNLRKNLITRNVEMNGKPLDDADINTLFIECKSLFEKVTKDLICSVIYSNKIEQYNPVRDFLESDPIDLDTEGTPNLDLLIKSIISDTPNKDKWVTKWLVSCVSSAYGTYSPLVLVLSGERQGTGKTHFFRYLLPKNTRYLFAESKMDNGKDDEILMTKKLIILDDEYGGKSKKEEKKLKEITAKEFINVREPYGRVSVDLRRISVFAGTSNDTQIISDPTGNRRILPIHVIDINQELYNKCDKSILWRELYALYKSGYDCTVLKDDIRELNESTEMFNASTPEEELLSLKLRPSESEFYGEWMSATEIINYLIMDTKYSGFSNVRMGLVLNKFGYHKKRMKRNGTVVTAYHVEKISSLGAGTISSPAPF